MEGNQAAVLAADGRQAAAIQGGVARERAELVGATPVAACELTQLCKEEPKRPLAAPAPPPECAFV